MSRRQRLRQQFFFKKDGVGWSDLYVSDRLRMDMVEVILRDIAAEALELIAKNGGEGCLFVRPHQDDAVFMSMEDLAADLRLAESHEDADVVALLSTLLEALAKVDPKEKVPIVLCDHIAAKLILIDTKDPVAPLRHELNFEYGSGRDAS
ncbi:hypothetical protein [Synechococcus elongatus]|uniref:hypothetical protein n=1 Tax=Synechococcus elongatus TaxID=32046 RepID=UPI000F7EFD60|nr:hypothetical protein [Synechococcus elongatus]